MVPPIQVGTTGVGMFPTNVFPERDPVVDEMVELFRTGEGFVLWSADASTTANKRISCDLIIGRARQHLNQEPAMGTR
jgi:hypothetical protein